MNNMRYAAILMFALAGLALCGCKEKPDAKADLSSPRAAARSFARAIEGGDAALARACVNLTGEKDGQLIDAVAGVFAASRKLGDVAVVKFGDPGRQLAAGGRDQFSILRKIEEADEQVTGDTATLTARHDVEQTKGTQPDTLSLKKTGGRWRLEGASISDAMGYEETLALCTLMTRTTRDLADEVSAGKFRTVQEVRDERAKRIAGALLSGAATQPGK